MSEEMNIPFKGFALIKRSLGVARDDKVGKEALARNDKGEDALGRNDKGEEALGRNDNEGGMG